ncbi:hypothetical protein ACHAW5_008560 [Stephanodiscus triporus]|uniref:CUE domain-containing protein n=1 Tax=Stephanodiscus triporus TaxID=2934178 RepID=A0ABD3NI01_9STRA
MFSDQGYTVQHLDAVLRHQGGHMENTVEALLMHGDGSPDELMRKLSRTTPASAPSGIGGIGGTGDGVDADAELARRLAGSGPGAGDAGGGGSTGRRRGRGAPTVLPSDFLRIPGRKYPAALSSSFPSRATADHPIASASSGDAGGQMMTDEQLARMLQDELFQEELRNNPEFSHLAGRRNPRAHRSREGGGGGQTTGRSNYGGAGGGVGGNDILEGLSKLGDTAKRRFQDLAASWNDASRNSNQPSRPLFGGFGGGGGGGTQGNAIRGNERRGLLSSDLNMLEEEEDEVDFVGGGEGGRDVEMNSVWRGDKKKD